MQSVDIACLNQVCCRFDSCQRYSRRWSYGALWGLISLHVPGSNPGSATNASVAQRQSSRLVSERLQVQLLSLAPECVHVSAL